MIFIFFHENVGEVGGAQTTQFTVRVADLSSGDEKGFAYSFFI